MRPASQSLSAASETVGVCDQRGSRWPRPPRQSVSATSDEVCVGDQRGSRWLRPARQSVSAISEAVGVCDQRGSRCLRSMPSVDAVVAAVSSACVRVVMVVRGRRAFLSLVALSLTLLLALHLGYVFDSDEQVVRRGVPLPADAAAMNRTLAALLSALDRHHVGYFVGYGTLLGAYQHHGPIPWDDDMDIVCNASDRAAVRRAAASLAPEYELQVSVKQCYLLSRF